jgi:iron complex transport system substrate-binding protein
MARLAPTRPQLSRRGFGGTIAVAALALVAACGTDDPASGTAAASTTGPAAFPVSIKHKYGTTEVTAAPERVVVVGLTEQDALLALGVVPVATTKWFGENPGQIWPWAKAALGTGTVPETLTDTDGVQIEKIAALRPDLIVAMYSGLSKEDYATLSKLAPVVAQPPDTVDYGAAWDVITTTVGRAVGKSAEAAKLVADTNAKLASMAAAHPQFKGKTALMASTWQGYYVYGPQDPRARLLVALGFSLPTGLGEATGKEFGANISKERIDLLDTDVLIWLVSDTTKDAAKLKADALYSGLDVAKNGGDLYLADTGPLGSATSFISVLSLPYLLDGLVPQLATAADGDPATKVEPAAS